MRRSGMRDSNRFCWRIFGDLGIRAEEIRGGAGRCCYSDLEVRADAATLFGGGDRSCWRRM
jgi:hypothetical protein